MKNTIKIAEAHQILSKKMGNLYNPYYAFLFEVVEKLNLPKDTKILDIGTGWGMMAINLALNGYHVHTGQPEEGGGDYHSHDGHEIHEDHIGDSSSHTLNHQSEQVSNSQTWGDERIKFDNQTWESNAKAVGVKEQIIFQPLDLKHLNIPDATYDAVFMYDTLHHVGDRANAIQECLRVVKPGGIICIIEMNEHGVQDCIDNWGFQPEIVNPRVYLDDMKVQITQINGEYSDAFIITVGVMKE